VSTTIGLTNLESLRRWCLRDEDDDSQDAKLIEYGLIFSDRVSEWCDRQFAPDPASGSDPPVDRVFAYDGSGRLDLNPYELRASNDLVIKLYTDRDASLQRTLLSAEYALAPRGGNKIGTYEGVDLIIPTLGPAHYGFGWQVTVTGRWGAATVPRTVQMAVWICVDNAMKNPGGWQTQQYGGYTVVPDSPLDADQDPRGSMPRQALWMLKPYKRTKRTGTITVARPPRWGFGRFFDLPRV
jgi:hypothetical protein